MTTQDTLEHDIARIVETLQRGVSSSPDTGQILAFRESFYWMLQSTRTLLMADHLLDLVRRLSSERLDTDKMLGEILEKGIAFLPAEQAWIGLLHGNTIRFRTGRGKKGLPENYELQVTEGLTGWAIRNRRSVRVNNLKEESEWKKFYVPQDKDTISELDVPLLFEGEPLGVLNAESSKVDAFDESDQNFLEALAGFAAIQLHYAALAMDREALLEAARELAIATSFEQLIRHVLRLGMDLVGATDASIGLVMGENIEFKFALGPHSEEVQLYTIPIGQGLTGRAVAEKRIVRVDDAALNGSYRNQISDTRSEMDAPILFGDQCIGVLNLESPYVAEFTKREESVAAGFATMAAAAIQNRGVYERQLQAATQMALVGDVTTGLLHSVSNQISLLRAFSFDVLTTEDSLERKALSEKIQAECDRLLDQVDSFHSRYIDVSKAAPINLRKVIQEVVETARGPANIDFELENMPEQIEVMAHPKQLKEVIRNLVQNSIAAMPNGGKIEFSAFKENPYAVLHVKDQGAGISRDLWERVFDRDYTTKRTPLGKKSGGIGLWWCKLYLAGIGGQIKVADSEINTGTDFRLDIPLAEEAKV